MARLRSVWQLTLSALLVVFAAVFVLLASLLPFRIRGYRPSFLVLGQFVRRLLAVLNVAVICPEAEKLRQFSGFVFPNHVSYADILVLLAVTPVSFLAKDEVRKMPFIGQIARAIGCVFVERSDKASREAARHALSRMAYHPPIVLYPEGQRGPGTELLPFRYGAFEIVTDVGAALLPCVITYSHLETIIWHRQENIGRALWRLAQQKEPVTAVITLLEPWQPAPGADSAQLSQALHQQMTAVWQQQLQAANQMRN